MNTSISSSSTQLGSVSSTCDLIDAKLEEHQLCGSKQCPSCGHKLEAKPDWLGLPAGVKFDPTDQELIEHLEAKVQGKESKSHPLIDEFIPTIDGEDGICYTHPEKLPGVTRDGLSRHFFHRPSKAYTTGTRKRRKIQTETDLQGGETRWHKTGKTRPVMANGNQKGCKKILVLYTNFGKNRKPEKTSWVMHQYHLGQHEEEREGELVVSKIFYQTQPRQSSWSDKSGVVNISTNVGERSSRKDQMVAQRDEFGGVNAVNVSTPISSIGAMDMLQMKADHFSYVPFRKTFDHEGANVDQASIARENIMQLHGTHEPTQQQQQQIATAAFHVGRPSHSISAIVSPPQPSALHHTSNILDHHHSFHVPTILHPTQSFQQQQQQHHDHKVGGSSASGLEDLIMSCTGTSADHTKQESSMINSQEAEWLKFSSTFWPDPDDPDHHG